jgi:hypothetical protein
MSFLIHAHDQARDYISSHPEFSSASFVRTVQNFGGLPQYLGVMGLIGDTPEILEQASFYAALYTVCMEIVGQFPHPPSEGEWDNVLVGPGPQPEIAPPPDPDSPALDEDYSDVDEPEQEEEQEVSEEDEGGEEEEGIADFDSSGEDDGGEEEEDSSDPEWNAIYVD